MFIPSMYKSTALYTCVLGNNTITAVDRNYTRLTFQGFKNTNASGFVWPTDWVYEITSNTNINVVNLAFNTASIKIRVEEFLPLFFKQTFYHGAVEIPTQQFSGTFNTGRTYSNKAFIVFNGFNGGISGTESLALAEAQLEAELTLDPGTGIVTATRHTLDYAASPGSVFYYYTIIDPK